MKAVMYHYVRYGEASLPHFAYSHADEFSRQRDYFAAHGGFVTREAFFASLENGECPDGYVLTFDDGFVDHLVYATAELKRRGLWGLFFVPTGPQVSGRILDVHRTHMLLGRLGGVKAAEALRSIITDRMLVAEHVESFRGRTY